MIETGLLADTTPKNEELGGGEVGGSVAEVGLCTWCHWGTGALRPVGLNTMMTTAMLQFYSKKKLLGRCQHVKSPRGGGNASDSFHYLLSSSGACFSFSCSLISKKVVVLLFRTASWAAPGNRPLFFLRHHVTGSSQDVLSGTPHRSDGVCERVERRDKRGGQWRLTYL